MMVVLTGCGASTPYKRLNLNDATGGYLEHRHGTNDGRFKYHLIYVGNNHTALDTVVEFWYRRASELCPGGYTADRIKAEMNKGTAEIKSTFYYNHEGIHLEIPINTTKDFENPQVTGDVICD